MATNTCSMYENDTIMTPNLSEYQDGPNIGIMVTLQNIIASLGIVANFTVVMVFLNHRKLRRKIPNMFIINQVSNNVKYCSGVTIQTYRITFGCGFRWVYCKLHPEDKVWLLFFLKLFDVHSNKYILCCNFWKKLHKNTKVPKLWASAL